MMYAITRPGRLTADALESWLVAARLRVAELQYLAMHPEDHRRAFVVGELSTALSEAMDELRVASVELRAVSEDLRASARSLRGTGVHEGRIASHQPQRND